jgi:hypothetical protein
MLFRKGNKSPPAVPADDAAPARPATGLALFKAKRAATDAAAASELVTDGARKGLILHPLKDIKPANVALPPAGLGLFIAKSSASGNDSGRQTPHSSAVAGTQPAGLGAQSTAQPADKPERAPSAQTEASHSPTTKASKLFERKPRRERAAERASVTPGPREQAVAASQEPPAEVGGGTSTDEASAARSPMPDDAPEGARAALGAEPQPAAPPARESPRTRIWSSLSLLLATGVVAAVAAYSWMSADAASVRVGDLARKHEARRAELAELAVKATPRLARDSSLSVARAIALARAAWAEQTRVTLTQRIDEGFDVVELTVTPVAADGTADSAAQLVAKRIPGCELQARTGTGAQGENSIRYLCKSPLLGVYRNRSR